MVNIFKHTDMNIKEFVKQTVENGGLSWNINVNEVNPTSGYMIGGYAPSKVIKLSEFNTSIVSDYIKENSEVLADTYTYIGSWIDTETKLVHLDVSKMYSDKHFTMELAINYKEIAIWDNKNGKEIRVKDKLSFSDFEKGLIYRQSDIYIPKLNTCINKTAFVTSSGYDIALESDAIRNAYNIYLDQ